MSLNIFGIRHHGPGCARSLNAALERLQPDIVLVEAPPEGEEVIELAANPEMIPPVAMIVYTPDKPDAAVFYPFASFSPEWNAIQFALKKNISLRLIDLPWKHRFALDEIEMQKEKNSGQENEHLPKQQSEDQSSNDSCSEDVKLEVAGDDNNNADAGKSFAQRIIDDPLGVLSSAAGFEDNETWWEQVIEQSKGESLEIFDGIFEAMSVLRERVNSELGNMNQDNVNYCNENSGGENQDNGNSENNIRNKNSRGVSEYFLRGRYEMLREAWMRQSVRKAVSEGFERIAVVCGAWHAPVLNVISDSELLVKLTPVEKSDNFLLRKLPKTKVSVTWIPWTFSRLSYRSGYGAGVAVPGWYEHLWTVPDRAVIRWVSLAARLLRAESLDASSANVIEAVRLSETLASLRDCPVVGISEVNDAILTVLCRGDFVPLNLIRRKLETGFRIGSVPKETPAVPLSRDIEAEQKRLRMKVSEEIISIDLDLRKETDRAKSRLLHRLNLLGVSWGKLQCDQVRAAGTFHEFWQLQWQVEFPVQIIEANALGNTIESAVGGAIRVKADSIRTLAGLTELIECVLPAEVSDKVIDDLLERLRNESAVSSDVSGLMLSIPPLVNVLHYGNVRGTKAAMLLPVYNVIFERILAGLVSASASLDDDAAARRIVEVDAVHNALKLCSTDEQRNDWQAVLAAVARSEVIHGLLCGRCTRILYEEGVISEEELGCRIGLSVTAADAVKVAQWMQGFLYGSGQLLLQFDLLWSILNSWVCSLSDDIFTGLLPLLRRAFSEFSAPEVKMMGAKIKRLGLPDNFVTKNIPKTQTTQPTQPKKDQLDKKRIEQIIPILQKIIS
ncbi:MAG: DUF5682 family protein [Planctomycetaceae bacterium]|jgi:hypothetical protein|nr:DUF5682 family protein [Planctomycetaceae bacterium]